MPERAAAAAQGDALDLRTTSVRVGIDLTGEQYRQLLGVAMTGWRQRYSRRVLPDDAVGRLIGRIVGRALDDLVRGDEDRRVADANRRHVTAVLEPWPTGPWSQDEVDDVITALRSGAAIEEISSATCRRPSDVRRLLREFGITPPRSGEESWLMDEPMEWPEFAAWLQLQGYENPVRLSEDRWCALAPKIYTTQLVTGEIGDTTGISDGWCYETRAAALRGQARWRNEHGEEPPGWFRHPSTGRRRARVPGEIDEQGREVLIGQEYVRR